MKRALPLLLVVACGSEDPAPPADKPIVYQGDFRALIDNPAPPEHLEGERVFFEETFGVEVLDSWPPAQFLVDLWQNDPTFWGEQFANFGWIPDPGDDLPLGLKRGSTDPSKVHLTCAACHVETLIDGRVWGGMPATGLRPDAFRVAVDDAWLAAGNPRMLTALQITKAGQLQQPGMTGTDSGDDPNLTPTDFPLYGNIGLRDDLSYTGVVGDVRSEVWLSVFSFGAGDEVPWPSQDLTDAFDSYMAWLRTPEPLTVDEPAAARGRAVFESAQCDSCHHVDEMLLDDISHWVAMGPEKLPGEDPMYPQGTIATDPMVFRLGDAIQGGSNPGPGFVKLLNFIISNRLKVKSPIGYAASDLHGLFTTAPYLHNGSVPTLEALLEPAAMRPTTFQRLGFTVDTTQPGMDNGGHEFGTTLSPSDKSDLIAYLNSL